MKLDSSVVISRYCFTWIFSSHYFLADAEQPMIFKVDVLILCCCLKKICDDMREVFDSMIENIYFSSVFVLIKSFV